MPSKPLTDRKTTRTLKDRSKHYQSNKDASPASSIIGTIVLDDAQVAEYQRIARGRGRELTEDEARAEGTRLVEFFLILARRKHEEASDEIP